MIKESLYKATVSGPQGDILIVAQTLPSFAKRDIMQAGIQVHYCHIGLLRITEPTKTNRTAKTGMEPVRGCVVDCRPWAWFKRL